MSLSALSRAPGFALNSQPPELMSSPSARRSLLVIGCVASMAFAAWLGEPLASTQADPELAHLLRGMAAIKATMVVAALGVLFWRFGQPVQQHTAAAYLAGAWLIAGATMLVWQLSFILLAALAFHVGVFSLLFVAWRDHQAGS
jgi:hypothetical protein